MKKYKILIPSLLILLLVQTGCNKDILNEKPSSTIVVPTSLDDMEGLFEDVFTFNYSSEMGELSSDDYYIAGKINWQNFGDAKGRNCYLWASDIYEGMVNVPDWNVPYRQVFYCNNILQGLSNISVNESNTKQWNNLKGTAHFFRAYAFYNLASIFCLTYDESTSMSKLGIPLVLSPNVNKNVGRSTLEDTYKQILADLKTASELMNSEFNSKRPNRPTKVTVYAMLARVYLSMRKYDNALEFSNLSLGLKSTLLEYSKMDRNSSRPFPVIPQTDNPDIIFYDRFVNTFLFSPFNPNILVDTTLYKQYEPNDLRKNLFFKEISSGKFGLKNSYVSNQWMFSGLAVDEMFLICAECYARAGEVTKAMGALNSLLKTRWAINETTKQSLYVDKAAANPQEALNIVLLERRKELVFRGLRWIDIKRLNAEGRNIELKRVLDDKEYTLRPNDKRFALPIPGDEIALSGMVQNER